jgi:hypothetical protein
MARPPHGAPAGLSSGSIPVLLDESGIALPFVPEAVRAALGSAGSVLRSQVGVVGVRRARPRRGLLVDYLALGARHRLAARVTASDPPFRLACRGEHEELTPA